MKVSLDETIQRFGVDSPAYRWPLFAWTERKRHTRGSQSFAHNFWMFACRQQQRRTCGETKTTIVLSVGSWQHGELPKLRAVEEKTTQLAFGSCVRVVCQLSQRRSN
jgi:hypothetical protein